MRLALLALHLVVQSGAQPPRPQQTVVRDSTAPDSNRRAAIRRPVTAALLASAFHDPAARDLFDRARTARMAQDSSLRSYDAKVHQRLSVKAAIGSVGLERLAYRQEGAARVRWQRGVGARIDVTGARLAIPMIGMPDVERQALQDVVADIGTIPIPYFPGQEPLWIGGFAARAEVNENSIVNPLADGAAAYYTYRSGESVTIRMNDGRAITLRQVDVRPRAAAVNVIVGSLWFDLASGQLVRAAYRLALPGKAGISVQSPDGSSRTVTQTIIKALMPAMSAQISSVAVEYELFEGFWLPRMQTLEGFANASFARVPVTIENSFTYESVNAGIDLAPIRVDSTPSEGGTPFPATPPGLNAADRRKWRDSVLAARRAASQPRRDSIAAGLHVGSMQQCDTSATRVKTGYMADGQVPIEMRIPCNLDSLTHSADLPPSIFDKGEEIFGSRDRDQLIADALTMAAQAPINFGMLPPPRWQYGVSMTRYNRVEGFSTGLLVEQQLGGGLDVTGSVRAGTADHIPNFELSLGRTNLSKTVRVGAYRRLVSASDWENPLSFGASLAAFFSGRDDGFYYRATGGELLWTSELGPRLDWRAFSERQGIAMQRTTFSIGGSFVPNIEASNGWYNGASVRWQHTNGLDPRGFRLLTDARLEAAKGDSSYGRGALDLTLSRGLGQSFAASLTAAGGSSLGDVPPQRRWFLGGTQTIRGQSADTAQSGNAFWFGRAEVAHSAHWLRTSLFGDLGWVGDRSSISAVGRPMSGVGVGFSFVDGAIRFDVARGLYPRQQTRLTFYLGARF